MLDKYTKPCRGQTWTITDNEAVPHPEHSYRVAVASQVPKRQAAGARTFIRFAATPTPATATAVPIDPSGITATLDTATACIPPQDIADDSRWFLVDGEGGRCQAV